MTLRTAVLAMVISTAVFVIAYSPIITRLSRGLASPYLKADATKRLAAAAVDGLIAVTCVAGFSPTGSAWLLALGAAYLVLRDGLMRGQSVGKLLFGLAVVQIDRPGPCSFRRSVQRNFLALLPGVNVAAVFLEAGTILRHPLGLRLGDRLASTQVVEGKDARDLVRELQRRLLGLDRHETAPVSRPGTQTSSPATRQSRLHLAEASTFAAKTNSAACDSWSWVVFGFGPFR